MRKENKVREQYDQLAEQYDLRWRRYVSSTLSFLKKWMNVKGTERILDVACGTGTLEQLLVKDHPNQNISGVDISEKMLAVARSKLSTYPNVTFFKASAFRIPFPEEHFDLVVCANSFHFFDDPTQSLVEMKRVLKTDGKLIILDWCRDYLICRLCDLCLKIFDSTHKQCYTQRELRAFLTDVEFHVVREQRFKTNLIWGMMIAEARKP
ncbi:MAG: methyltransferase domain-containing protein [Candidatus Omnitrophica bacterium]|nr:methyltransferase domain-containing protein [Candidatus Omnitrophota bacterium]